LNLKKIKALISFDRRLILKTFSAELHKATTELLGYQWLIIYMLSLGLVLSTKILKNDSKLEYFGKISPKRPISGRNRNFEFLYSLLEVCKKTPANIYTKDHSYYDAKSAAFLTGIPMKFRKNSVNSEIYI